MHLTGAYWGEVKSNQPLGIDSSTSANFSPDGSNQGGDYQTILTRPPCGLTRTSRVAATSSSSRSTAPAERARTSTCSCRPPISPTTPAPPSWSQRHSWTTSATPSTAPPSRSNPAPYTQFAPIAPALTNGKTLNAGDVLQLRLGSDGGTGRIPPVRRQKRNRQRHHHQPRPQQQDGYIIPLVQTAEYRNLPQTVEQNDTFATRVAITSRPGTTIDNVLLDTSGSGTWDNTFTGNNTNQYLLETSGAALATGTWTPRMRALITDNGVQYARDFTSTTFTVNPEHDYSLTDQAQAKQLTLANMNQLATILSAPNVIYLTGNTSCPIQQLSYNDALAGLQLLTNGKIGPGDAEMNGVNIYQTTETTPTLVFPLQGTTTVETFYDLTKTQVRQLRAIYNFP